MEVASVTAVAWIAFPGAAGVPKNLFAATIAF
jgi:hypothetical protein